RNGDLHDKLGCVLARYKHDFAAALLCFLKAVELEPQNARAHYNLGRLYEDIGRIDEAIASYRAALALDPTAFDHNINLGGLLCDRKHDYDGAVACFRAAIQADPNDPRGYDDLGIALYGKGQVDEAIVHHRKAIEVDSKFAPARINLGFLLRNKGAWDEAIDCFRKAIELDPKAVRAYFELGVILNNFK